MEAFDGRPEMYRHERGSVAVPVAVFAALHENDRLTVLAREGVLQLRVGDHRIVTLTRDDGTYRVPAPDTETTASGNVARWLAGWFSSDDSRVGAPGVALVARSDALAAPLLERTPRLAAGDRALRLAWRGGAEPWRVRLVGPEGRVEAALDSIERPSARLPGVVFRPGRWRIEVRDSLDASLVSELEIEDGRPHPPAELVPADADSPLASTLEAAWLASLPGGSWTLEAYQQLDRVPEDYEAAATLRRLLETGARPPSGR